MRSDLEAEKRSDGTNVKENVSLYITYGKIVGAVFAYWIVSISMVFLNGNLLDTYDHVPHKSDIRVPLFLSWFQCVVTLLITVIGSMLCSACPIVPKFVAPLQFRWKTIREILPLSLVFVSMITFNNLCLKSVGVAFYFVGRSLSVVFNVLLTYLLLHRRTSRKAIACCAIIVIGFILGVLQEQISSSTITFKSITFCVAASLSVSLNSILTVRVLSAVNDSIWLLSMYLNLIASILLLPLLWLYGESFSTEQHEMSESLFVSDNFRLLLPISGVLGFLMGYVTNLQIAYTSPLTHNISGTAKACAQTVLATALFNQRKTFTWWLSNAIVLIASASYTRVRQIEIRNAHFKCADNDRATAKQ